MTQARKGPSKMLVIALVVIFVMPVVLAKLALDQDWFNRGATNKGNLLNPVLDVSGVLNEQPPKWRLVYTLPADCDSACENALFSIHQVWLALGRESDRAEAVVLVTPDSDKEVLTHLQDTAALHAVTVSKENVNKSFNSAPQDAIFVVDTLNNAMLYYPVAADKETAVMESRDILADIKKLMKLSRIG
ncbi:hypothetical protein OCL06_02895 [Alteromonas sp. ASW11-19]|uniref:Cytochrome oxidase assembly protein n=1 Tax=Alteromonas salexigens TaxID=2982530 RepID=A0ABT2VNK9_9ALTE|nr:hypothetical protein [Alteromonas salexigens]MCU7553544.1 hypothetical protein [Alteromonas salexigens]